MDTGVIDENIDRTERRHGIVDGSLLGNIKTTCRHGITGGAQLGSSTFELGRIASVEGHMSASSGKPACKRQTNALGRAGNQRAAARQIE